MPTATNLVVKNAANVDKTFTLLSPAAGYNSPAEWALKEGALGIQFPTFTLTAKKTTNASRQSVVKFRYPVYTTDSVTQLPIRQAAFEFNGTASIPDVFPENMKDDAVAYVANLIAHAIVRGSMRDGLPAN